MITLHHVEQTRSMRTLWLLHELEVPFEVSIHAFDKSLRDPGYLAISPAGRVPSLEIDGERMFETGAIAEYLCERFSPDRLGRMPGAPDRMAWLVWIHFAETVSQHCAALTQQHVALRVTELVLRKRALRAQEVDGGPPRGRRTPAAPSTSSQAPSPWP